jgi:protein-tyrosine phosphatase
MRRSEPERVSVLFVCLGNICRSPTAHVVFRQRLRAAGLDDYVGVASAATHGFHVGQSPDRRAQEAALERGYPMSDLRARQVGVEDLTAYDYVLAMDEANYRDLQVLVSPATTARVERLLDYLSDEPETEVPDPYYGGVNGFERVLDLVEGASDALLEHLRHVHRLP